LSAFSLSDSYVLISADCHAGASIMGYKPYLEKRWHDEFEQWARDFYDPWLEVEQGPKGRRSGMTSGGLEVNWDEAQRNADLEQDGVTAEVIFPNTVPPFFPSGVFMAAAPASRDEYDRRWAGLRAHNRWLKDFCDNLPGRRAGIAQIFLNDVDDAVAEIRWVKEAGLNGGILMPSVQPGSDIAPLFSTEYEPIWAACEELDVPVSLHGGGPSPAGNQGTGPAVPAFRYIESRFFSTRSLTHVIFGGVFERHPNLKFVMTEQGLAWVPERLAALDSVYRQAKSPGLSIQNYVGPAAEGMSMLPSEYFKRNCYLGVSFMLQLEADLIDQVGADRIMWGSDYPHSEGTFPYTREALRACFAGAPPARVQQLIGTTAADVYGFDLAKLAPVADRVGLRVDEISQPLSSFPKVPEETVCPVFTKLRVA
jgi:predicted TIM-barrel fold metal-dependent hydrolase